MSLRDPRARPAREPRATSAGIALPLLLALLSIVGTSPSARSAPAAPDTTLERFFGSMSDSTDRYFGRTTAPVDTARLDSSLAASLALGPAHTSRAKLRLNFSPGLRFNRVDSGVYGAAASIGRRAGWGRVLGDLSYASGPRVGLGGVDWLRSTGGEERRWVFEARGRRGTEVMDRVRPETVGDLNASIAAVTYGEDTRQFLRRTGYSLRVARHTETWRATAGWRDEIESALEVTTPWNLAHADLPAADNVRATHGRAREGLLALWARAPRLPIYGEMDYRVAREVLGSDFEYRLTRIALGANLGIGRWSALAPQVMMGRLIGAALPQEMFYLDRAGALTTHFGDELAGTHVALARLDWIGTRDLLALAHFPHPPMFPLQGDLFTAAGAVWGADPYGGPSRPGGTWPAGDWSSEAGVALAWQPGIPDPTTLVRFAVAWPLDGRPARGHMSLSVSRALFLIQSPDR